VDMVVVVVVPSYLCGHSDPIPKLLGGSRGSGSDVGGQGSQAPLEGTQPRRGILKVVVVVIVCWW